MTDITTVTLELLRLGPPHNQLLSPLTRYLGVCGNHRAEEVSVPWEHRDFTAQLDTLRYTRAAVLRPGSPEAAAAGRDRQGHLDRLGREITGVVASVEGLKNRLSEAHGSEAGTLIHLEVVLSASELALLPFELTRTFPGGPGSAEQYLLLQPTVDIELTRRVRGVVEEGIEWPDVPKILFIVAQPEGMEVPKDAHTQALLQAVGPFLGPHEPTPAGLHEAAKEFLTIVPAASVDAIQEACSKERFSYVHILAHGLQDEATPGKPYGLALHAGPGQRAKEIVNGARLAAALRTEGHRPAVVTVSACDSGNVGDIIHSGASLAHELHRAGLPLVVASQFPLSFQASIDMVDQIYKRMPRGEDPRQVIHDLRRKLYARYAASTHDWASLVVYASLPDDLGSQLSRVNFRAAQKRLFAAMSTIDHQIDLGTGDGDDIGDRIEHIDDQVEDVLTELPSSGEWVIEADGLRGSMFKRLGHTYFMFGQRHLENGGGSEVAQQAADGFWRSSLIHLTKARDAYRRAARSSLVHDKNDPVQRVAIQWLLIQELSLDAVLGGPFDRHRWSAAKISAEVDVKLGGADARTGALSSLVELYLLLWAWSADEGECAGVGAEVGVDDPDACALDAAAQLVDLARAEDELTLRLTRRQLDRYRKWLWNDALVAFQAKEGIERKLCIDAEAKRPRILLLADKLIDLLDGKPGV